MLSGRNPRFWSNFARGVKVGAFRSSKFDRRRGRNAMEGPQPGAVCSEEFNEFNELVNEVKLRESLASSKRLRVDEQFSFLFSR